MKSKKNPKKKKATKQKKARTKIKDLPKDMTLKERQAKNIRGGRVIASRSQALPRSPLGDYDDRII